MRLAPSICRVFRLDRTAEDSTAGADKQNDMIDAYVACGGDRTWEAVSRH